jgi:hypothetical protein
MASTYLTWTPSGAGNRKTWTYSGWIKKEKADTAMVLLGCNNSYSTGTSGSIAFHNSSYFHTYAMNGISSNVGYWGTTRLFRDTNAWYHIVVAMDTTQATTTDRQKLWVNGVQETSFAFPNYPTQNYDCPFNDGTVFQIGGDALNGVHFDGVMSHVHFCDGTAYDASAFGEYDANGVWKAKTSPSVTYGTNGFFILKDGNSVTDQSVNGNNFTVAGGTLTNTEDCPANVFAILNPLIKFQNPSSYSNGNNTVTGGGSGSGDSPSSTLAVSSGKYYCEVKIISTDAGGEAVGIIDIDKWNPNANADEWFYRYSYGYGYLNSSGNKSTNNAGTAYGDSYTNGDIVGIALDLDNNYLYFSKNGVWQNSGDPTSGASGTGSAFNIASGNYVFSFYHYYSHVLNTNFGNGYFGTTAVASAGTNTSGIGIFEYDVPTGYTALCTKGLNL